MGIEQWGALELAGATIAYWGALFVGVVLYARWRVRSTAPDRVAPVERPPEQPEAAPAESPPDGIVETFTERINVWIIILYLLVPPLALALIRFWF